MEDGTKERKEGSPKDIMKARKQKLKKGKNENIRKLTNKESNAHAYTRATHQSRAR